MYPSNGIKQCWISTAVSIKSPMSLRKVLDVTASLHCTFLISNAFELLVLKVVCVLSCREFVAPVSGKISRSRLVMTRHHLGAHAC